MKRLICCSSTSLWQTRRCLRTVQDNFALDRVFALIEGQPLSKSSEGEALPHPTCTYRRISDTLSTGWRRS